MALRELLATFGFEFDESKLLSAKKGIDGLAENVKTLAEKLFKSDLSTALRGMTDDVKTATQEFRGWSTQLGINTQDAQRWAFAAKLADVEVQALAKGFSLLQKNASASAGGITATSAVVIDATGRMALGGAEAEAGFKALGISVKDTEGKIKDTSALMREVGLAIGSVQDPSERTAVAMKIFGEEGIKLIPLFNRGAEGLDELLSRLDDLGGGVGGDAYEAILKNERATKEWDMSLLSLKSRVVALLPPINTMVQLATKLVAWINKITKETNLLQAALILLGTGFLYLQRTAVMAGIKTALAWAPTILAFTAIALIIDDLITLFRGGDSAIGRLINTIFGVGSAEKTVAKFKETWDDLHKTFTDLGITADKLPIAIAAIAAALVLATSPITAIATAVGAATIAIAKAIQMKADYDKKTGGEGMAYWWLNAKHNLGVVNEEEYLSQRKKMTGESDADIAMSGMSPSQRASAEAWEARLNPPTVRVSGQAPASTVIKRVDQRNEITVKVENTDDNPIAAAARKGVGMALDDERRAQLAALETSK